MTVQKIIPPGFADVSINITRGGDPDPYSITFGVEIDTAPLTTTDLGNIVGNFMGPLRSLLWDSEHVTSAVARVGQDGGDPTVLEVATNIAGLDGANRLPPNCAVLVKKLTTLGGRRGRGRLFWPSVDELSVDSVGVLGTGTVSAYNAAFADALDELLTGAPDTNVANMVLFHSAEVPGPAAPAPTVVTGFLVDSLLSTQRRRLRK